MATSREYAEQSDEGSQVAAMAFGAGIGALRSYNTNEEFEGVLSPDIAADHQRRMEEHRRQFDESE